jgi:hypothetical protein
MEINEYRILVGKPDWKDTIILVCGPRLLRPASKLEGASSS